MVTRDEWGNVETPAVVNDGLENLRLPELRQKCIDAGIADANNWNKDACIEALRSAKEAAPKRKK